MKRFTLPIFILSVAIFFTCQDEKSTSVSEKEEVIKIAESLPMIQVELDDLGEWTAPGSNWSVAGDVNSDFQKEWYLEASEGRGILVNQVEDQGQRDVSGDGAHLFSAFSHGDLEISLEFLVPRNSNSGLYFQSRYELQIRDTAEDEDISSDDCGGIYAQWVDPVRREKTKGGVAPSVNAARAPGLWQHFKVIFRAPEFNEEGTKISNARFEKVWLNGYLIHENVEVTSPTIEAAHDDEVESAPLMIQGDHGPVAFRNIRYKKLGKEKVELTNIGYEMYTGEWDYIPDFSTMTPVKSGNVENLDELEQLAGQNDHFGFVFKGDLVIPVDGEYLFETSIDDGGDLFINGELVVHNLGEPGLGTERGTIYLTSGTHELRMTYFEEIWLALIILKVEGPEIPKQELASTDMIRIWTERSGKMTLKQTAEDEVNLIRGFANHKDQKLTHILSVGDPAGIHYSYDTRYNTAVSAWKGEFADVAEMWINRGQEQLLKPMNARLDLDLGVPLAILESTRQVWPSVAGDSYDPQGFYLDDEGRPVFRYLLGDVLVSDQLRPSERKGLLRQINVSTDKKIKNMWFRIGTADNIYPISDGYYSVGNLYYVHLKTSIENAIIRDGGKGQELMVPVLSDSNQESITYEIIW